MMIHIALGEVLAPNTNIWLVDHADIVLFIHPCPILCPPLFSLFLTKPLSAAFIWCTQKKFITIMGKSL